MKKTLALILAIVMCFSLFAIGASAANEEFTDKAEIDHTKAVNLLVGLGVINGMGDGTFAPNGTVTRAQMCQIVAKICNGGVLPNVNTTEQHFTDVPTSHWAFKAVEYCVGKGIVAGFGDGTFKPEQALTASQCAKMLLVAMGFNETAHKLTGASWEIYTAIYANANDFYKELSDVAVDQPITREHVAQMARNMLDARVVKAAQEIDSNGVITTKYSQTNAAGTADNPDVIEEYFGVVIENGYLTGSSYNKTKKEWTYNVTADAAFGGDEIAKNDDPIQAKSLVSKTDYNSLTGRKVVFVYDKDDTKNVFDIYAHEDSTIIATGIVDDVDDDVLGTDDEIEVADVKYDLTNTWEETSIYQTNGKLVADDMTELFGNNMDWWKLTLVDNTGDGKIDAAFVKAVAIAKVTALTKTTISMQPKYNGTSIKDFTGIELDDEDWAFDSKIEKKDFVVITVGTDRVNNVVPMEKVTGKADAVKTLAEGQTAKYLKAKIGGVYYNFTPSGEYAEINSSYDLQVYNGFAFDVDKTGAASTDLLLVKTATSDSWDDVQAKVMFPDGTSKTVTIACDPDIDDDFIDFGNEYDVTEKTDIFELFTYTVNKDGEYELEQIDWGEDEDTLSNGNFAGYDGAGDKDEANFIKKSSDTAAKLNGMIIDDTATIMIHYNTAGNDKYTVIKGSDLKTYNLEGQLDIAQVLYTTTNGVDKVQFAFLSTEKNTFGTDNIYAYITDVGGTSRVDGTKYTECTLWTVDGEVVASIESDSSLVKGAAIVLDKNSDGTYELAEDQFDSQAYAITGYSETDKYIEIEGFGFVLPDDLTVLNVNSKDVKGIGSGEIETADEDENENYVPNALVYVEWGNLDEGTVDTLALVIDVNENEWTDTEDTNYAD